MKNRCHCGLKEHFCHFRARKLGALGLVLMGIHIIFHIVECLVLPAILIGLSGQIQVETETRNPAGNEQNKVEDYGLWRERTMLIQGPILVDYFPQNTQ